MTKLCIPVLALSLAGCATTSPLTYKTDMCGFSQTKVVVNEPGFPERNRRPPKSLDVPTSTLVISGGGEHGAFGAGFLTQWKDSSPGQKLPKFGLVTGISTGAILATWAFIDEPEIAAQQYRIGQEADILRVYGKPSKSGSLGITGALTALRKNALGDLSPLQAKLTEVLDFRTLKKVTEQPGRLLVGAVEIDTGEMYTFNMKEMAQRAVNEGADSLGFRKFQACYVKAILASSSVPLAAKPVFIDNRMYIDGGARFGVFVDYLNAATRDDYKPFAPVRMSREPNDAIKPDGPNLYILMNGTQWIKPKCGKADEKLCTKSYLYPDKVSNTEGQRKKWDLPTLAFRSNDALINQIYRLSVFRVQNQYKDAFPASQFNQRYYFARVHRQDINISEKFSYMGPDGTTRSCIDWRTYDDDHFRPLEFHKTYMACLIEYGRSEAKRLKWFQPDEGAQFDFDDTPD